MGSDIKLGGDAQNSTDTPGKLSEMYQTQELLIDDQRCLNEPEKSELSKTTDITKGSTSLQTQFKKGQKVCQNLFRNSTRNAVMINKEINLAMMPVQISRKTKYTDQFNDNYAYNMDTFNMKRDMKGEL